MIAVIFEVEPKEDGRNAYLDRAAILRPELLKIEGFISVERFQSLTHPEKLLSLSFFEDEAAVKRWRQHSQHRSAQDAGRQALFADYRIRIAHVLRDYGLNERDEVPA
ncbi:antibiotic biosynthesis monooxygenase family protein [Cohaesibacter celericrescens]|uniref:Antibiotic biosynthesis monooxygenase n=1 Tax=Cohaesibacter celericrescens TaxID=2067669 RepID=A0A2N5XKQ3_9HYPH|nr:antibiotic biosynthesis monooxygenase [Cohaesibacter celericrescens]PLW75089.1 antibiotic biosynthesis monooxygenase [Cohaesibacter celericrescens]